MKGIGSHLIIIERLKRFAPLIIIAVVGIVLFFTLQNDEFSDEDVTNDDETNESELSLVFAEEEGTDSEEEQSTEVIVDIKGEVKNPGVYEVAKDARIQTVIQLAGGFTKKADEQQINLAQKVQDEMVIYVAKEGELDEPFAPPAIAQIEAGNSASDDLIQVNVATEDDLTKLQGIGPSKAQAIIDYREENGPFKQVEDLLEVNGIGEKTLENIREQIVVP